ncbi:MAG: hypothetical protein NTW59_03025 [Candidatus Diapherotrites archaeon]|nr:hypothetical protein [Candidatus Diapherotrites archaeon]
MPTEEARNSGEKPADAKEQQAKKTEEKPVQAKEQQPVAAAAGQQQKKVDEKAASSGQQAKKSRWLFKTKQRSQAAIQKSALAQQQQKLLQLSEISLWIDTYDDIFSDFDPRPYSQRALSDDFLLEAKKASRDRASGNIELRFLVPTKIRNPEQEGLIRKRLHEHFKKHSKELTQEVHTTRRNGIAMAFVGMLMVLGASYIYPEESTSFLQRLLFVVLEPGGWFMTWMGLDGIFGAESQKKTDLDFYRKMSKCEISFQSY